MPSLIICICYVKILYSESKYIRKLNSPPVLCTKVEAANALYRMHASRAAVASVIHNQSMHLAFCRRYVPLHAPILAHNLIECNAEIIGHVNVHSLNVCVKNKLIGTRQLG